MVSNQLRRDERTSAPHPRVCLEAFDSDRLLDDDHALVEQARGGDRRAFGLLIERYWYRLYRWLYHLTHHQHGAEDLAQEAFLKAFAALRSFRPGSNFRAWLFRIAYNGFVNQWRQDVRVRQPFPEHLAAPGEGPAEQAMSEEGLRLLARAVGRLPPEFRAAFLLRVEEGLSFQEIGAALNVTEATARWRVFKARQKLMNVLAPQLDREKP